MSKTRIEIDRISLANTIQYLKTKKGDIAKGSKEGITKATFFMEGEIKESISGNRSEPASVDTGRFRASVKGTVIDDDTGEVSSDVEYGPVLEYGSTKFKGRRHFNNSMERNQSKINELIEGAVKEKL